MDTISELQQDLHRRADLEALAIERRMMVDSEVFARVKLQLAAMRAFQLALGRQDTGSRDLAS